MGSFGSKMMGRSESQRGQSGSEQQRLLEGDSSNQTNPSRSKPFNPFRNTFKNQEEVFKIKRAKYLVRASELQRGENYNPQEFVDTFRRIKRMEAWIEENQDRFNTQSNNYKKAKDDFDAQKEKIHSNYETEYSAAKLGAGFSMSPSDQASFQQASVSFLKAIEQTLQPPQTDSSAQAGPSYSQRQR